MSVKFVLSVTIVSMLTPVVIRVAAIPNNRMIMSKTFRPFPVLCHISFRWNSEGMMKATMAAAKPNVIILRLLTKQKYCSISFIKVEGSKVAMAISCGCILA